MTYDAKVIRQRGPQLIPPPWSHTLLSSLGQVLPRRWVVARFFAWINRTRELAKDFEATIASATAFVQAARSFHMIRVGLPGRTCSPNG
jgi:transposase